MNQGRPMPLTHIWMARRTLMQQPAVLHLAVIGLGQDERTTRVVVLHEQNEVYEGTSLQMIEFFDQFMIDKMAEGFTPVAELGGDEVMRVIEMGNFTDTPELEGCRHLHGSVEAWGKPANVKTEFVARRDLTVLARPREAARGIWVYGGDASVILSMLPYGGGASNLVDQRRDMMLSYRFAQVAAPPLLAEVARPREADQPLLVVDMLMFDDVDLRARPWSERRALAEQLVTEVKDPVHLAVLPRLDPEAVLARGVLPQLLLVRSNAPWRERSFV